MAVPSIQSPTGLNVTEINAGDISKSDSNPQNGNTFSKALDALSKSELKSDELIQKLAEGEDVDLHQVAIATTETDVNFKIALAIRDRLVESYREVMRMTV